MGTRYTYLIRLRFFSIVLFGAACFIPAIARAYVIQVPIGADPFKLPNDRVLCGNVPEGWQLDTSRKKLTPPSQGRIGQTLEVTVGVDVSACFMEKVEKTTLILTGNPPAITATSVAIHIDDGNLEFRGRDLEGVRIEWKTNDKTGSDVCLNVTKGRNGDLCLIDIDQALPIDPAHIAFRWIPAGGRLDADVITYDRGGGILSYDKTRLSVARVLLSGVFTELRTIDVASGEGRLELAHSEAIASVDCGAAHCEVTENGLAIRAIPATANTITVRLKLLPRVFLSRGDALENAPTATFSVLRCPLAIVSGEPVRNADNLSVLVRLDSACGNEVDRLHWTVGGENAEVTRAEKLDDGAYVLLWVGRISRERLTITASRADNGSVLAIANIRTWEPPSVRTSLTLSTFGEIDFIPKNRDAILSIYPAPRFGKIVPISVAGAYTITKQKDGYHIRGEYTSGGYTAIRFGYRPANVPDAFAETDFATIVDPVQRPIREASIPAAIGASSMTHRPIVELVCSMGKGKLKAITPGTSQHIPFSERDSCRLIMYRNRIPLENGEQRVDVDVSVESLSGSRPEAQMTQRLILRHGPNKDVIWIRGAKEQYDKITIRVTHIVDDTQFESSSSRNELLSSQWTIVTEDAWLKFYVTAAIPASLYRFSNDRGNVGSGPLALNFGVLSRLTWLDSDGHEGLVGLEGGVMGMGLASENDRQLAVVTGLGLAVPLGNINQPTQAAVNIHAWVAYSLGKREATITNSTNNTTTKVDLNPWAFVFGPSITIGNVGTLF
jgi:hypothetical protein